MPAERSIDIDKPVPPEILAEIVRPLPPEMRARMEAALTALLERNDTQPFNDLLDERAAMEDGWYPDLWRNVTVHLTGRRPEEVTMRMQVAVKHAFWYLLTAGRPVEERYRDADTVLRELLRELAKGAGRGEVRT